MVRLAIFVSHCSLSERRCSQIHNDRAGFGEQSASDGSYSVFPKDGSSATLGELCFFPKKWAVLALSGSWFVGGGEGADRMRTWLAMGEDEDVDLGRHGTPRSISHLNHCEIVDLDESRKRYPHVFQRLKGEDFVYFTFESL